MFCNSCVCIVTWMWQEMVTTPSHKTSTPFHFHLPFAHRHLYNRICQHKPSEPPCQLPALTPGFEEVSVCERDVQPVEWNGGLVARRRRHFLPPPCLPSHMRDKKNCHSSNSRAWHELIRHPLPLQGESRGSKNLKFEPSRKRRDGLRPVCFDLRIIILIQSSF